MRPARRGYRAWLGGAGENPFIAAGQAGQQVVHVGRERYLSGAIVTPFAFGLVAQREATPLHVQIVPAQAQQLAGARASQQQALQIGGRRSGQGAHGGKPSGQLLFQQGVGFGLGLAEFFAGFAACRWVRVAHGGVETRVGFAPGQESA